MCVCLEVTNWINQCISNTKNISEEDMTMINNKIDALYDIAENYDKSFRINNVKFSKDLILRLENNASTLWNLSSIVCKIENDPIRLLTLFRVKLFISILLSIDEAIETSNGKKLRSFKCYITIIKTANQYDWPELLMKATTMAEKWLRIIQELSPTFNDTENFDFKELKFEYYLLNTQLMLKSGDFETAKLYEKQTDIPTNINNISPATLLELCQIIYNSMVQFRNSKISETNVEEDKQIFEIVSYFLRNVLSYLSLDLSGLRSNIDYSELRYNTLLLLTDALIFLSDFSEEWKAECQIYLNLLQNEYPKKTQPFQLAIKYCKKKVQNFSEENIKDILMELITSVDINVHLETILGCINDFSNISTNYSIVILDYIFNNKLDFTKNDEITNKIILARFYTTTQSQNLTSTEIITSLKSFCKLLEKSITSSLPNHICISIITLLWNLGKKLEKDDKYLESIDVFEICLFEMFCNNFEDKVKIQRTLLSLYIKCSMLDKAKYLLESISDEDKLSPLFQYYILKINIIQESPDRILDNLNTISQSSSQNAIDVLILAISDIKFDQALLLKGMNLLFQKLKEQGTSKCSEISLPTISLLRYSIQIILKTNNDLGIDELIEKNSSSLVNYFQEALEVCRQNKANFSHAQSIDNPEFKESISSNDIEWFASTCYNISIRGLHAPGLIKSFAELSLKFIELIPLEEFTFSEAFNYWYMLVKVRVLNSLVQIHLTHYEDETNLNDIKRNIQVLYNSIKDEENESNFKDKADTNNKNMLKECLHDTIKLQFEILIKLRDKDKILLLLSDEKISRDKDIQKFVESILISKSFKMEGLGAAILCNLIEQNVLFSETSFISLSFWFRILLQWSNKNELEIADAIPIDLLKRLRSGSELTDNERKIFKEELEVICAHCWNKGVNHIIKNEHDFGSQWCSFAAKFASLIDGSFESHFKELWNSLQSSTEAQE